MVSNLNVKWPKRVNGVVTELPTELPSWDDVCEEFLPSSMYVPFQKFSLGNLHWRLQLLCCYLLLRNKLNPNTFAHTIPTDFKGKEFSLEDLKRFSDDVERSAKDNKNTKQKKKKNVHETDGFQVPFYLEDDGANYDDWSEDENEETNSEAPILETTPSSGTSTRQPSSYPTQVSGTRPAPSPPGERLTQGVIVQTSSRTLPILSQLVRGKKQASEKNLERSNGSTLPNGTIQVIVDAPADCVHDLDENDIFNTSHNTGTPQNSLEEDNSEDELLAVMRDESIDDQKFLTMMENTDLASILSGHDLFEPVLQVFNFQILTKGKCYRAHAHDGKITTTKFAFTTDLNNRVEKLVGHQPVLRITNFKLYNGSFIVVTDFVVIKVLPLSLGTPDYLTDKDYEYFKGVNRQTHGNLPQTPTLVAKKLTSRHVNQIEGVPTRSASQRLKNRSNGSNS